MTTEKPDELPFQTYLEKYNLKADWDYWCRIPTWTVTETAYLLHGIEPRKVLIEGSNHIATGLTYGLSEFKNAERDLGLLVRAKQDGLISERNSLLTVLEHCDLYLIEIPIEMRQLVVDVAKRQLAARKKKQKIWDEIAQEDDMQEADVRDKPMGKKKEENLLRLIGRLTSIVKDKTGQSQKELIAYLHSEEIDIEKDGLQNKGLSERSLKEVFAKANAILKFEDT